MPNKLNRRGLVRAAAIAVGAMALGSTAQAQQNAPKAAKLLEIKNDELKAVFKARFGGELNFKAFDQLALAINTWLSKHMPGCSGFWTGEQGKVDEQPTHQVCVVKRD